MLTPIVSPAAETFPVNLMLRAAGPPATPQAVNTSGTIVGTSGDDAFVIRPGCAMARLPDFGFSATAMEVNHAGWITGSVLARLPG
ncbi:hypothetical protein [Streptomyces sp. NPDC002746]